MRFLALALSVAVITSGGIASAQDAGGKFARPAVSARVKAVVARPLPVLTRHPVLQRMLVRNNGLRAQMGLRPHRINPQLTRAAQNHAEYMARTGVFSHYANLGPNGRAQRFGFRGGVRENIAMGYRDVDTAFVGWRNSSGHWASIVSATNEAGFGYAVSANGTPYWVAVYGTTAR